ncbi:hypothetical protein [Rivibacter subsaxonicus]|uniref:Uncharacterized protein n=1 Tax=Rivibacter subsaxonicus TaxID=457575 RepID=A0A4Q7VZ94_9BURK|nr:hypothetical protein [Rivibacter subsaxonicus]RZU02003.1 hypothetical protein EV670_0021 [Rivibacter subsaxonicus]
MSHRHADEFPWLERIMKAFEMLSSSERWAGGLMAAVASAAVLSCAVLLFAEDGRTPWLSEGSAYAPAAQSCQQERSGAQRHRCVREVVAAAVLGASAPVLLSQR